jgi:ketosteroid isomerase-like protein
MAGKSYKDPADKCRNVRLKAELTGTAKRAARGEMRMSMAEVFVMREGKIAERRAWVIPLGENGYR